MHANVLPKCVRVARCSVYATMASTMHALCASRLTHARAHPDLHLPRLDASDGVCGHDRGGKARPDLVQSKEAPPKSQAAKSQEAKSQDEEAPAQVPTPAAPTAKVDFFSDEPLKRKRGGKARPDLAQGGGGAGGGGGGDGAGGAGPGAVGSASETAATTVQVVVSGTDFNTPLPRKRGGKARAVQSEQ